MSKSPLVCILVYLGRYCTLQCAGENITSPRPAHIIIIVTSMNRPSLGNDQGLAWKLSRLRNALQFSFPVLHHTIGDVRTEHQAKVPHVVHLTEHPEQPLVEPGVLFP